MRRPTLGALDQARALIDLAGVLGEPVEDPLLLFSTLYGVWVTNLMAFTGEAVRKSAMDFLALAEAQRATIPLMIGHRLLGTSLLFCGEPAKARTLFDQVLAHYVLTNMATWRRGSVTMLRWLPCPIGDWACGFLATLMPRLEMQTIPQRLGACAHQLSETCLQR